MPTFSAMTKRVLAFFLLTFFSAAGFLRAQNVPPPPPVTKSQSNPYRPDTIKHWSLILYGQYSHLFYKPTPGLIEVKFPYRIIDPSGTITSDTFSGSNRGTSKALGNFFAIPGVELIHGNVSYEFNISPMQVPRMGWRWNFYAGIGYRIRYDKWLSQAADLQPVMENFPVTLSLGLQWHNAVWDLGRVNLDYWQKFRALGYELQQTEDEPEERESAHVDICFQQTMLVIQPGIAVGWRPKNNFFDVELKASPYFPFTMESGFTFLMNDSDNDDRHSAPGFLGVMSTHQAGLNATYNGGRMVDAPYKMNGWMLTVRVGFHLHELD